MSGKDGLLRLVYKDACVACCAGGLSPQLVASGHRRLCLAACCSSASQAGKERVVRGPESCPALCTSVLVVSRPGVVQAPYAALAARQSGMVQEQLPHGAGAIASTCGAWHVGVSTCCACWLPACLSCFGVNACKAGNSAISLLGANEYVCMCITVRSVSC